MLMQTRSEGQGGNAPNQKTNWLSLTLGHFKSFWQFLLIDTECIIFRHVQHQIELIIKRFSQNYIKVIIFEILWPTT